MRPSFTQLTLTLVVCVGIGGLSNLTQDIIVPKERKESQWSQLCIIRNKRLWLMRYGCNGLKVSAGAIAMP